MKDENELAVPVNTGSRDAEVTLRRPSTAELEEGKDWEQPLTLGSTICEARGTWGISDANRDALTHRARDGGPALTQTFVVFGGASGTGMRAWDALPDSLRQLLDDGLGQLGGACGRVFRLIRWRFALGGPHNPFRILHFQWSPDGVSWQDLPWKLPLLAAAVVPELRASATVKAEVLSALARNEYEPISHDLLREASELVDSNPRGALIISISAAEIRFKEFVTQLVPAASWLVTEVPTPPLIQMLTRYLPDLLRDLKRVPLLQFVEGRDKKTKTFNDPVLRELERGITMRNQFTHRPMPAPDPEQIRPLIGAVRDLLGMLDYYSGHGKQFICSATHAQWFRTDAKPPA